MVILGLGKDGDGVDSVGGRMTEIKGVIENRWGWSENDSIDSGGVESNGGRWW